MSGSMDVLKDLELLLRSRHGLIHLDTTEEERAHGLLAHLADSMGLPLFTWTRSRGLVRDDLGTPAYDTKEPIKAFQHVTAGRTDGLYHFMGVGADVLQGSLATSHLRDAARTMEERDGAMVLTGDLELPTSLEGTTAAGSGSGGA